jgi:hypothetical protein
VRRFRRRTCARVGVALEHVGQCCDFGSTFFGNFLHKIEQFMNKK